MEVQLLSQDKEKGKLSFIIKDTTPAFVNTLRRTIMEEVPTLAIEDVEFRDNSSSLYDEMIAHRLGLIPIKTDLKSYNPPSECTCKGKGCAKCTLKLTLSSKSAGYVYSGEIKSKDAKCKPVLDKLPITKLLKGQKIELIATAVMGQGKDHVKWSPGLVHYKGLPILKLKSKEKNAVAKSNVMEASARCNNIIKDTEKGIEITDLTQWKDSHEQICEEYGISVTHSKKNFIFYIESWGQLEPREIVKDALSRLSKKTDAFVKLLK